MDRRTFIGAAATSLTILAPVSGAQQPPAIRRIGWLWNTAPLSPADFRQYSQNLREFGWIDGQNLVIEQRYSKGDARSLAAMADELVRLKVDLIVAEGTIVALAAKKATGIVPIVVVRSGDPVRAGLVASLARPGGNVTGTSTNTLDLDRKRFQLLKEVMPATRRVGELVVIANPLDRVRRTEYVSDFGMQTLFIEVAQAADMEKAVAEAARRGAQVLHVTPEPLLGENLPRILRAAQGHSLPILVDGSSWLDNDGVLLSYGPDDLELNRQAASLIDKVLRGARPADLPIQQPRKFEIGINLKTAKAFAIPVPPSLLLRADVVIQ